MERENGIRSLERGLALLEELNLRDGARPSELSRSLGLPRSSVYRILETLEELRYVQRSACDSRFMVTERVRLLARGFTRRTRLGIAAGPVLHRLAQQFPWSFDVAVQGDGMMYTQETTIDTSPMSMARNMVGKALPVLRTASGRAVLAFTSDEERAAILALVQARELPEDQPYLHPDALGRMVAETRRRGYSLRTGEGALPTSASDRTSSIGVPVRDGERVIGALVVIWITSAMSVSEAVAGLLGPIQDAAREIGATL